MILDRLTAMSESAAFRDAFDHRTVTTTMRWAARILAYGRSVLDTSTKRTNCAWIDSRSAKMSVTDYVQFHWLRINALPTRVRTSRSHRGDGIALTCRAGCQSTETVAQIVQEYHWTQGGRIK